MKRINWKDVIGYEGIYTVSDTGLVKKLEYTYIRKTDGAEVLRKEKIMKTRVIRMYETVGLTKNSVQKTHPAHRLIAEAFIPNPEFKKEVNHIDGCKLNNQLDNLEWVTKSENALHAFSLGLRKKTDGGRSKKLIKVCPNTSKALEEYPSLRWLEVNTSYLRKEVSLACRNGTKYKNFYWKFV